MFRNCQMAMDSHSVEEKHDNLEDVKAKGDSSPSSSQATGDPVSPCSLSLSSSLSSASSTSPPGSPKERLAPRPGRGLPKPVPTRSSSLGNSTSGPSGSKQNNLIGLPGYDPNRIPASIFASRPSNPCDWSVASNDSLFSIHVESSSLSKENFGMLYRSGEFPKLEEPISQVQVSGCLLAVKETKDTDVKKVCTTEDDFSSANDSSSENDSSSAQLREIQPPQAAERQKEEEKDEKEKTTMDAVEIEEIQEENHGDKSTSPLVRYSPSISSRSDLSNASANSFAFPVLSGVDQDAANNALATKESPVTPALRSPSNKQSQEHVALPFEPQPKPQPRHHARFLPRPRSQSEPLLHAPRIFFSRWFSCFRGWPLRRFRTCRKPGLESPKG